MSLAAKLHKTEMLNTLFRGYEGPAFVLRLWDGWQWTPMPGRRPVCAILLQNPDALAALTSSHDGISLGEAFIRKDLDVEGDLFSAFAVAEHLFQQPRSLRRKCAERIAAGLFEARQWFRQGAIHSRRRDRASIAYHYDQPVNFFEPWLGPSMVYSCAYFRNQHDSLDTAQEQKLDLICRKLRLQDDERFLDIGCGWGSLALHAASRYGAQAEGITLSREQASMAKRRISEAGLGSRCLAELRDYRDLADREGTFDKVASVGMYEHVGRENLPEYFAVAYRLLRPGGLFLNHGIARHSRAPIRTSSFVNRYVFPDGKLVTLDETLHAAEEQGLEVRDVENLREHYAMTLRLWVEQLRRNSGRLLELVPPETYRIWLLYMAGSAAAFSRGDMGVYQVLLNRPDHGVSRLPLTREDLYARPIRVREAAIPREPAEMATR